MLALLAFGAASAHAQLTEAQPGARVRVRAPGIVAGRFVGTVLAREGDTLRLGSPNAPSIRVPIAGLTSLEISRGKSRLAGASRGVVWGLPVGLAAGLLFASSLRQCDQSCGDATSKEKGDFVLASSVSGAVWGAVIGAIVGRERWERFDITPRASMDMRRESAQLGVHLAF